VVCVGCDVGLLADEAVALRAAGSRAGGLMLWCVSLELIRHAMCRDMAVVRSRYQWEGEC
jgi:hypothetical protein